MFGNVSIPFRTRLEPGDTDFTVKVPQRFVNETNRKFGIESITLMPEFQNTQAFAFKLDSTQELEEIMRHPIHLEVNYGQSFSSMAWTYLQSQSRVNTVLQSINQHYEHNKPEGTIFPPLFFDWVHLGSLEEEETVRGYQEKKAQEAYGEAFDSTKHATWLPWSLATMSEMNNCIFPTTNKQEFLDEIRIRMWVGPNTTITFPNDQLLLAFGFSAEQIPLKSKKNQVPFVNEDLQNYTCLMAWNSPQIDLPVNEIKGTRIHCYTTSTSIKSRVAFLETTKQREYYPIQIASDFGPTIESLGKSVNCFLRLEFVPSTKKFVIRFPNNPNIDMKIYVPSKVVRQLGFDPSVAEFITQSSVPSAVKTSIDTVDLVKKAKALVYDTGLVVALLDGHLEGKQSDFAILATLHPQEDGVLRNQIYYKDVSRLSLSSFTPDMRILLYRFNDNNEKMPLDWPVGGYVFGEITGKV